MERFMRPCRHPGCLSLTNDSSGYCESHINDKYKEDRPSSSKRGYNSKWAKARKTFLTSHPYCAECEKRGVKTLATDVDHIIPHKGNQSLFWDTTNWQPLCHSCHSIKTQREGGRWY